MRREPGEHSEMVSQLLFGESYEILNESNGFLQIITWYDSYTGWIDRTMHREISDDFYSMMKQENMPVQKALLMSIEKNSSSPRLIFAGSTLPGYDRKNDYFEIDKEKYHIRWTFEKFDVPDGISTILKTAAHFMNAPYFWGGRSVFGSDCSGFIQVLFKIHGIKLSRDVYQQAEQGKPLSSLSATRLGDLAFFGDPDSGVIHTGMIISPAEIIHNSGFVHIDRLDETGIFNLEKQQYTHRLHSIKRITGN